MASITDKLFNGSNLKRAAVISGIPFAELALASVNVPRAGVGQALLKHLVAAEPCAAAIRCVIGASLPALPQVRAVREKLPARSDLVPLADHFRTAQRGLFQLTVVIAGKRSFGQVDRTGVFRIWSKSLKKNNNLIY